MRYLSTFLSEFRNGFQQGHRYEVSVLVPPSLLQAIITSSGLLQFVDLILPSIGQRLDPTFSATQAASWLARGLVCESAFMPSRTFDTTDMTMYGFTEKFPVHSDFPDLSLTFRMPLIEADNAIPRFFNYWHNYIQHCLNDIRDGMDFRWPSDYYGTLLLSMFDRQGHTTGTYKFERSYPRSVQSVPLNWDAQPTFLTQSVDFTYSYWTLLPYTPPPLVEIDITL